MDATKKLDREYKSKDEYLIDLIHLEYEKDRKSELITYRFLTLIKKIFSKKEEIVVPKEGYIEEKDYIKIFEKIKAKEITASKDKNLIIAKGAKVSAGIKANTLYVAGEVIGDVEAKYVFIKGRVKGNINAEYLEIFPKGLVVGDVKTHALYIERNGGLKGNCDIK